MSATDRAVEKTADRLEGLATKAAEHGKPGEKVAPLLEEDAEFLRKMTPTKVRERLSSDAHGRSRPAERPARDGQSGIVVLAAAFALGVVVAKLVDWRSYAT
jgi:hypothetical protein